MSDPRIPKGFILKARKIEDSDIAHASPCARELFDLVVRKANFQDRKCGTTTIRRGQWLTTYEEIQELLHWQVGFRKCTYTRHQINAAMKYLRSRLMVTTAKTTRGMFINVLNYELYQRQDNYERHSESHNESHNNATGQRSNYKECIILGGEPLRLATILLELILHRKHDFKRPDLQAWAGDIDRMIRLDGRSCERIEAVIRWCQADNFWQNNILSADKLRQQFDRLEMKMGGSVPAECQTRELDPAEAEAVISKVRTR